MDPLNDVRVARRAEASVNRAFALRALKFVCGAVLVLVGLSFLPRLPLPFEFGRSVVVSFGVRVALVCGAIAPLAWLDARRPKNILDPQRMLRPSIVVALLISALIAFATFYFRNA